jgi:citrate lyase beta subunit
VTEEDRARAQTIVDAYDAAARDGKGALMLDGMLVDEPVVLQARRTLERTAR